MAAAGGAERVAAYCAEQLAATKTGTGRTVEDGAGKSRKNSRDGKGDDKG
ncbi:hypothetical protein ACHBTE_06380 [Streptomyces sp. M41]